jgi:signal peptidase I
VKADVEDALAQPKNPEQQDTAGDRIKQEVISWVWVILAFLFIEGTLVQARVIPSGSMENTVLIGDHLIVSRIAYDAGIPFTPWHEPLWRNPKGQQIIVFRAPLPEEGYPDFIKRCIGVPGDHIKIIAGQVYVNDVALKEPYALRVLGAVDVPGENFPPAPDDLEWRGRMRPQWAAEISSHIVNGELVVPPGDYFMMGDNRDNSYDSRFWGFVPRQNIIGTPLIIYMSIDAPEEVWEPGHIAERFETYLRAFIHPGEVRWRRLFHIF